MGSGLSKGSRKVHPNTKSSKRNNRPTRNAGNNNGPNSEPDEEKVKRLEKLTANARNKINKLGNLLTAPTGPPITNEEMIRLLGNPVGIPSEALAPYISPSISRRFTQPRAPRSEFKSFEILPPNPPPDGIVIKQIDIDNRITEFMIKYGGILPSPEDLENFEIKFIEAEEKRNTDLLKIKALLADPRRPKKGLNKRIEELDKKLITAYIDYEAIKIYFNESVKHYKNMHAQSIRESTIYGSKGLGSVAHQAIGGKRRHKNVTRRKG